MSVGIISLMLIPALHLDYHCFENNGTCSLCLAFYSTSWSSLVLSFENYLWVVSLLLPNYKSPEVNVVITIWKERV